MGKSTRTWKEYTEAAAAKGLVYGQSLAAATVITPALWTCQNCGKSMRKTFRAVAAADFGCRCQNGANVLAPQYFALAAKLGIKWVGQYQPLNTRAETEWELPNGVIFTETYRNLGYKMTLARGQRLGLPGYD